MGNEHTIGAKIQSYRKLQNMTQDELSHRSGIYLSTIKKYENGERNPKPDQLLKISEALGVSINVFLDFNINTVSDVLSLIMKLDDQSIINISVDTDDAGTIIPNSIRLSFEDPQINDAICSYLEYKGIKNALSSESIGAPKIETSVNSLEETKKRLLLYNERIKKSAQ